MLCKILDNSKIMRDSRLHGSRSSLALFVHVVVVVVVVVASDSAAAVAAN